MKPLHSDSEENAKMLAMCGMFDEIYEFAQAVKRNIHEEIFTASLAMLIHKIESAHELKKEVMACGVTEESADVARNSGCCGDGPGC